MPGCRPSGGVGSGAGCHGLGEAIMFGAFGAGAGGGTAPSACGLRQTVTAGQAAVVSSGHVVLPGAGPAGAGPGGGGGAGGGIGTPPGGVIGTVGWADAVGAPAPAGADEAGRARGGVAKTE